jgi:hypothetical protein
VAARERVRVEQHRGTGRAQLEEVGPSLTEQIGMAQLVNRVFQVQPPQERIRGELGGAQDVAPTVAFYVRERDQLAHAPIEIAPDPPVNRSQHPVNPGSSLRHQMDSAGKRAALQVGISC